MTLLEEREEDSIGIPLPGFLRPDHYALSVPDLERTCRW